MIGSEWVDRSDAVARSNARRTARRFRESVFAYAYAARVGGAIDAAGARPRYGCRPNTSVGRTTIIPIRTRRIVLNPVPDPLPRFEEPDTGSRRRNGDRLLAALEFEKAPLPNVVDHNSHYIRLEYEVVMLDVDPTALGLEFGGGAIIGGVLGFATKQVARLLAVVIGVELMAVRYLESQVIVVVVWNRLSAGLVQPGERAQERVHWLESVLSMLSVGAGFTSGFLIGYHRG